MGWPKQYGGGERPPLDRLIVAEELITAGAPVGASWFADRQMGPALIAYGSEDQRQRYLPLILSGETTWCIGMSEPDAGSDLASLQTSAVRDGADLCHQRAEDLDELRRESRLLLSDLSHLA